MKNFYVGICLVSSIAAVFINVWLRGQVDDLEAQVYTYEFQLKGLKQTDKLQDRLDAEESDRRIKQCESRLVEYKHNICQPRVEDAYESGVEAGICASLNEWNGQNFENCMIEWNEKL